jgi:hypothetical protein
MSIPDPGNWINAEIRKFIQVRGYCVVDFSYPVTLDTLLAAKP